MEGSLLIKTEEARKQQIAETAVEGLLIIYNVKIETPSHHGGQSSAFAAPRVETLRRQRSLVQIGHIQSYLVTQKASAYASTRCQGHRYATVPPIWRKPRCTQRPMRAVTVSSLPGEASEHHCFDGGWMGLLHALSTKDDSVQLRRDKVEEAGASASLPSLRKAALRGSCDSLIQEASSISKPWLFTLPPQYVCFSTFLWTFHERDERRVVSPTLPT